MRIRHEICNACSPSYAVMPKSLLPVVWKNEFNPLHELRNGTKFGPATMVDGMQRMDSLMPTTTMLWAFVRTYVLEYKFTREDQDNYAIQSYERSAKSLGRW
jgi:acetyl-CoA acetyltransferase